MNIISSPLVIAVVQEPTTAERVQQELITLAHANVLSGLIDWPAVSNRTGTPGPLTLPLRFPFLLPLVGGTHERR